VLPQRLSFAGGISLVYLPFFSTRRRHTRWPRDWSSDVCSSDLRVQLPHVSEVAEVREPHAAIREHVRHLREIKGLIGQRVWSLTQQKNEQSSCDGEHRGGCQIDTPARRADRVHEIWRRFAERQRADQNAERETASGAEPRRDNFHR